MLVGLLSSGAVAADRTAEKIHEVAGIRGGLAVHVGCGEGRLTAALRSADNWTVQGLDTDPEKIALAREHFRSLEADGRVSAAVFDGRNLPYADNLVNLLVVSQPSSVDVAECRRVLCPGGVMVSVSEDESEIVKELVKPWPENIGQWTHYLHGPDNNAVGSDQVVGPPRHLQWTAGPRYSRSHDHLASVSAMVSSGGRLFSIVDEGSIAFAAASPRWRLVARDAFSGVLLWEREIPTWEYHLRDFRAGPADVARRLVADRRPRVRHARLRSTDQHAGCGNGRNRPGLRGDSETQEFLVCGETLFVVLGAPDKNWPAAAAREIVQQQDYEPPFEQTTPPAHQKQLVAVHADTGQVLWKNAQPYVHTLMPSTLAVADGRAVFQNAEAIVCLDAATGEAQWRSPRPIQRRRLAWSTPTLVVHDGLVFSADRRAADTTGELLWIPSGGYHQYIQGDEVQGELIALDLETGNRYGVARRTKALTRRSM
jgi:SAM-dependent methyltransferase